MKKSRLIIISNRLPVTAYKSGEDWLLQPSSGGLVSGINAWLATQKNFSESEFIWIGWPGSEIPELNQPVIQEVLMREHKAVPVFLNKHQEDTFYAGFCNRTIWPLFHYFPSFVDFSEKNFESYVEVNQLFANTALQIIEPGDTVWVHDYQLMMLPGMIREKLENLKIGFFLHIPFPTYEMFRLLPLQWQKDLMHGVTGADLIGFHTHDYTHYFMRSVSRSIGYEVNEGKIMTPNRQISVDTFPMGIEFNRYFEGAQSQESLKYFEKIRSEFKETKIVLSLDRLDYSKGIANRLLGFEIFLEKFPEWRGKVILYMVVVPSRANVDQYRKMKAQIDELAGRINGRFGRLDWQPIHYQYRSLSFPELTAIYRASQAALVTPLRDGMNLVAKEYVACQIDDAGILILSEFAGAVRELAEAVIINPNHARDIAQGLHTALTMPNEEKAKRNMAMRQRTKRYDVIRWVTEFLESLDQIKEEQDRLTGILLNEKDLSSIRDSIKKAKKPILFLDYDGTLVDFFPHPNMSKPDVELKKILVDLAKVAPVCIITGRDRASIEDWFDELPVSVIAEHGIWFRPADEQWRRLKNPVISWKDEIHEDLKLISDRLPGSFVEEKEFSLVLHFRNADPEQVNLRIAGITDELKLRSKLYPIQILNGNKIVEIRAAGVDKGSAARDILGQWNIDFVFAAGDDLTDEDLFKGLPENSITIKIGRSGHTSARYRVSDFAAFRNVLTTIANSSSS
ncbi:MAG: bifunctional alpha,alpha-trehalose-phosphate synthase (UDP-forming)/trehalose-phosphatase [Leptospiraceae bacterium]|nr:bifunctional alpha,alpha-trehalose-phosphate synthase (UDP-forming)/trehalose-phosphatase [Leptospiraceae bacterium]